MGKRKSNPKSSKRRIGPADELRSLLDELRSLLDRKSAVEGNRDRSPLLPEKLGLPVNKDHRELVDILESALAIKLPPPPESTQGDDSDIGIYEIQSLTADQIFDEKLTAPKLIRTPDGKLMTGFQRPRTLLNDALRLLRDTDQSLLVRHSAKDFITELTYFLIDVPSVAEADVMRLLDIGRLIERMWAAPSDGIALKGKRASAGSKRGADNRAKRLEAEKKKLQQELEEIMRTQHCGYHAACRQLAKSKGLDWEHLRKKLANPNPRTKKKS